MPFTSNIILQLHSVLCRYMADPGGRFKSTDNEIIENILMGQSMFALHQQKRT